MMNQLQQPQMQQPQMQQPQMQGQQYPYQQQPPMQQPSQISQQQGPQIQQPMQSMQRPKNNMNTSAGTVDSQGRQMMGLGNQRIKHIFLIKARNDISKRNFYKGFLLTVF
jgi:hypothetical protein